MDKGLKYNPKKPATNNDLESLAVDLNYGLKEDDDTIKYIAANTIRKFQSSQPKFRNHETATLKRIHKKQKSDNLIFVKADKGNTLVIMNKPDYVNKVESFLKHKDFIPLNKDPTLSFNKTVKNFIKDSQLTTSVSELKSLTNMNPQTPKLYGLPKLHKHDIPIRPVVSYTSAPSYKLAFKYNTIFKDHSQFSPKHSVKNSLDLIDKLKPLTLPQNGILVSFDVSSLFINVPVHQTLRIATKLLSNNNTHPSIRYEIEQALSICSSQNYFQFNDIIYQQVNGLAMGSPFLPSLLRFSWMILKPVFLPHLTIY